MSSAEGLAKHEETSWDAADAAHLWRRAGFGAGASEIRQSVAAGAEATLERLFEPMGHDASLVNGIDSLISTGSLASVQAWWMALLLAGGDPLRERMTLMWHDHFATSQDKVDDARLMLRQNRFLREHALGDFRVLLYGMAKDPAMLIWLDGESNKRGAPNENFAREVMELFALGIGNYTETDVQEAARAFTGWGTKGRAFHFRSVDHDSGDKQIFGRRGPFTGEEAIDLILSQSACAHHLARRLLDEFVGASADDADVQALAEYLRHNDWSLELAVRNILESELFRSRAQRELRIASPIEFIVGTSQRLEVSVAPSRAAEAATVMGQALFRPPSVKGWDGGRAWINAGTWLARHNFAVDLAAEVDLEPWRRNVQQGGPSRLVETLLQLLLPEADDGRLTELVEAWLAVDSPTNDAWRRSLGLILTSPEYHLV